VVRQWGGYEYFDKLCPGKLTWKNAGNGNCVIFAGQYRRHASDIIFVHALWLAYCARVNQFTLSVIFTVDNIYYPQGYAPSGVKRNLSIDAQTLLFASCTALVQFSPMLIIPILTPINDAVYGRTTKPITFIVFKWRDSRLSVYKNNRHADIAFICSDAGNNFNSVLCSKLADSRDGLS
jgi:hypothetical protein